jgi:hypothetical protein
MRLAAAALALLALVAPQESAVPQGSTAQTPRADGEIVLTLPRAIGAGETAFLEIEVGAIGRAQIEVTTDTGQPLGTVAPFGPRAGQNAGTFTLPVPAGAIRDGRVALRLMVRQGGTLRPPTAEEVRGAKLSVGGTR